MKTPKITSLNEETESILGGERRVIFSSKETAGDIYLVEGVMPEGSSVPVHVHQYEDEIFHVLEGQVQLTLGKEEILGRAGDMIYLPRGIRHGIRTHGANTARVLNYVIPGENFEKFFQEMHAKGAKSSDKSAAGIAEEYCISFE
jgi:quercetin dioxygenase-like cupin family protein